MTARHPDLLTRIEAAARYEVQYGPPPDDAGGDIIIAVTHTPAYRVNDHFAVRSAYYRHDAGDGLFYEAAVLDHIPTGLKLFGGNSWSPHTAEQCEAFAASIATLPLDWSAKDVDPNRYVDFIGRVTIAAERCASISWDNDRG